MRMKLWRYGWDFGDDDPRVKKLERKYKEDWPRQRPGPKPVSGDDLLP